MLPARLIRAFGGWLSDAIMEDIRQLSIKLLETLHLNVPERQALPNGGVPFSEMVAGVEEHLADRGWFPFRLQPGKDFGEGATIELRDGEIWVHEQHEIGVGRYSEIESRRATSIGEAVKSLIEAVGGSPIDGVRVDWSG